MSENENPVKIDDENMLVTVINTNTEVKDVELKEKDVEVKEKDKNIKSKDEICENCGKTVSSYHMRRHMKSAQCYSFDETMKIINENIEKIKKYSKYYPKIEFTIRFASYV